jgi:hypothetical protein
MEAFWENGVSSFFDRSTKKYALTPFPSFPEQSHLVRRYPYSPRQEL